MSLDLYDKEQVLNVLLAVHTSSTSALQVAHTQIESQETQREREAYRRGVESTLEAVAEGFGLVRCEGVPRLPWRAP
jgi:hypothetical protein